ASSSACSRTCATGWSREFRGRGRTCGSESTSRRRRCDPYNGRTVRTPPRRRTPRSLAVSDAFRRFVLDQLEELGDVADRSMFGGVGLYHRGVFFGIIARDTLYLKVGDANRSDYKRARMKAFRPYPN